MPEPQHTFEHMLTNASSFIRGLTYEAREELDLAIISILNDKWQRWCAFCAAHPGLSEKTRSDVFEQVSLFGRIMPSEPSERDYHMLWGAFYGILIGQLNARLPTSLRPHARHAAIDCLRRDAAERGINFA